MKNCRFSKISKLMKDGREKKGLTQVELAMVLGFSSPQFVSNIERGLAGLPPCHIKTLSKLISVPQRKLIDACVDDYRKYVLDVMSRQ